MAKRYKAVATILINSDRKAYEKQMGQLRAEAAMHGKAIAQNLFRGMLAVAPVAFFTKMAASFEQSLAGVEKTTGLTGDALAALGDDVRGLARETGMGTEALLGITQAAGQLGVTGRANLVKYTETISMLGSASNLAGEEAAFALSRFINVTNAGEENVDRLAASVVALGNAFATTEAEAVHTANAIAAKASVYGLSAQAALGYGTALNAMGQGGEAAGMAFSKMFLNLKMATDEGGAALAKWANIAQVSVEELSRLVSEDADMAIRMVLRGLERFGTDTISVLRDAGLVEERALARWASMAGNVELVERALDKASTAWEENTALTEEFNTMMDTLEKQTARLMESLKDIGLTLGKEAVPALRRFVDALNDMLDEETIAGTAKLLGLVIKYAAAFYTAKIAISAVKLAMVGLSAVQLAFSGVILLTNARLGVMAAATTAVGIAAQFARIKLAALTLGLTWVISEYGPKLIAWVTKSEGKLDWLSAKFKSLWIDIKVGALQVLKFLHVGFGAFPAAIAEAVRVAWNALVPQFMEIEKSALGWLSGVLSAYDQKITSLQDEQLVYYQKANDAVQKYRDSVIELNEAIARNPFDTRRGIPGGVGPNRPPAKPVEETTETTTTPTGEEDPWAWLERSSVRGGRGRAGGQWEAARRQFEEDQRQRRLAAQSAGMGPGAQGEAAARRRRMEEAEAARLAAEEQLEFERRIEERKMENELEIYQMKLDGKHELEIEHRERMNELAIALEEAQRAKDEAEIARIEKLYALELKMHKKKNREKTMDTIAQGAASMKALGKQHTALAQFIAGVRRAEALYNLAVKGPALAAEAFGRAQAAYPPPFGQVLGAAAAAAVVAQMAAAVNAVEGSKLPSFREGGMIPGLASLTDSQLAMVQPGEVMTPVKRYSDIEDGIRARLRREEDFGEPQQVDVRIEAQEDLAHFISVQQDAAAAQRL